MWQSRYKARLIDEPEYLSRVIHYIHLNPVRAGLTEDPSKYTFSGHRELMGKVRTPLCDVDKHVEVPKREHPMDPHTVAELDKYQTGWTIID